MKFVSTDNLPGDGVEFETLSKRLKRPRLSRTHLTDIPESFAFMSVRIFAFFNASAWDFSKIFTSSDWNERLQSNSKVLFHHCISYNTRLFNFAIAKKEVQFQWLVHSRKLTINKLMWVKLNKNANGFNLLPVSINHKILCRYIYILMNTYKLWCFITAVYITWPPLFHNTALSIDFCFALLCDTADQFSFRLWIFI